MKVFLKQAAVILICITVFAGSAFLYLRQDKISRQSDTEQSLIPYSSAPDNVALLFELPHGTLLFELDFGKALLTVTADPDTELISGKYFTVSADERLVAGMIDRVGGIELLTDGELLRFTGHQVTELFGYYTDTEALRNSILEEYLKKAGEVGLSRQDLVYLIENSQTDLTVPDCFYWPEYTAELCQNYIIEF